MMGYLPKLDNIYLVVGPMCVTIDIGADSKSDV